MMAIDGVFTKTKVEVTPQLLAELFWAMDCEQQADFFAALDRMAGLNLCFQMAYVVSEIQKRSDHGDHDAQNGFQTMLSHAKDYVESATDYRVWEAKRQIREMSTNARKNFA